MERLVLTYLILICSFLKLFSQNLQWQEIGRMPIPVKGHRAVVLDSVILIIGGFSDSLNQPVNFIQEFNPYTNSWRIIGQTKTSRVNFYAEKEGDSLFFIGGVNRPQNKNDYYSMEIWKKNSQPYILRYNPIFNRTFSTGIKVNQKLYLFGGRKNYHHHDTTRFNYLVEYDIEKDSIIFSIERFPNSPENAFHQSVAKLNSKIYIFGGVVGGVTNNIYLYDLQSHNLNKISMKLLRPRAGAEAVNFDNNSILIIGGYNEFFKAFKNTEIFSVSNQTYTIQEGPPLESARKEFAAVRFNNSIYVFGGENQFDEVVPTVEKLDLTTKVNDESEQIPDNIILYQNYPNPFNPSTTISFKIPQKSKVFLEIFDIFGKRIKTLVDDEVDSGIHQFTWNGIDDLDNQVASGIYFYRLIVGKNSQTKKMILIR